MVDVLNNDRGQNQGDNLSFREEPTEVKEMELQLVVGKGLYAQFTPLYHPRETHCNPKP